MAYRQIQFLAVVLAAFTSLSDARVPKKILDGERASKHDFPYQVYMENTHRAIRTVCGGVIIDTTNILTTAHCFYLDGELKSIAGWTVKTGTDSSLNTNSDNIFGVLRVTPHPDYNASGKKEHDIGIVKLRRQISYDDYQTAAVFPRRNVIAGTNGMFLGWGVPKVDDKWINPYLQKVEATIISQTECRAWIPHVEIHSYKFCTWSESRAAPCYGDSGSPLIYNGEVVGLLAQGACNGEVPAIFTNVYYYRSWIRKNI